MKKLIIICTLLAFIAHTGKGQIIDSLPYFKKEKLLEKVINPFLKGVVNNEGVAALKHHIDPAFKPPVRGWIRDSMFNHIRQTLSSVEFQDGDDLFLMNNCEFVSVKGEHHEWVVVAIAAPEITNPASDKGPYDPLRAYDLNPNELSLLTDINDVLYGNPKFADQSKVIGLLLAKSPNGQYKIYPDASKLSGGWPYNPAKSKSGVTKFKGSDEELQAIKTADKFLESIRNNDKKGFRNVFGKSAYIEEVWTDMRPLSLYRNLPEYASNDLEFERVVSFENRAGWSGHFSTHIAVYRLPEGMKASSVRAPTDFLNPVTFPAMDGSSKDPAKSVKPTVSGFIKVPDNYYETIFGGPLIGTVIGNEGSPEDYITIILKREPGTNNFNIGMPPSLKQ